jgi:hypothetical protein
MMDAQSQAAYDLINAVNDGLDENDSFTSSLVQSLQNHVTTTVAANQKTAQKIANKVSGSITKWQTQQANNLDSVATSIVNWLNGHVGNNEWQLHGLAVKGNLIGADGSLDTVVFGPDDAATTDTSVSNTLLIDMAGLTVVLSPLIEVLREIRDRMPPQSFQLPKEPAAIDESLSPVDTDDPPDANEITEELDFEVLS